MTKKKYHRGRRRKSIKQNTEKLKISGRSGVKHSAVKPGTAKQGTANGDTAKQSAVKESRIDHNKALRFAGAGILCLLVMLFVQMASASGKDTSAQITLTVNNAEILQDEAVPAMTVMAVCPEGQKEILLDESSGYRVKDLVQRMNLGDGKIF